MKVYYSRVSTEEQNEEGQLQDIKGFDYVFTDKCSGQVIRRLANFVQPERSGSRRSQSYTSRNPAGRQAGVAIVQSYSSHNLLTVRFLYLKIR